MRTRRPWLVRRKARWRGAGPPSRDSAETLKVEQARPSVTMSGPRLLLSGQPMNDRRAASPAPETDAKDWGEVEEATELLHEERFPEALYALRDIIKANPRNPYAYYYLGVALFETAEPEPARDAYRAAIRIAPDYLGARVALSHVLR